MKKLLILILALVMCLSVFTSCEDMSGVLDQIKDGAAGVVDQIKDKVDDIINPGEEQPPVDEDLEAAISQLYFLYEEEDTAENPGTFPTRNFEVLAQITGGSTEYTLTWSENSDLVEIKAGAEGFYKVVLPYLNETEVAYVLTVVLTDANGATKATLTFDYKLPVYDNTKSVTDPEEGVAYKIFMNQVNLGKTLYALGGELDSQGKYYRTTTDAKEANDFYVEAVNGGFKFYYVENGANHYVEAYLEGTSKRLRYTDAENATIWKYDAVTNSWQTTINGTGYVLGTYNAYDTFSISENSHISASNTGVTQFPAELVAKEVAESATPAPEVVIYNTPAEIMNAAAALEAGKYLSAGHNYTLTGVIVSVDTAFSADYGNVTVTMTVNGTDGKTIQCFRLKGTGADVIKVGDTITVTGKILHYVNNDGTVDKLEFDSGCTLDSYVPVVTEHTCESVCPDCGKCLDAECTETACAEKCQGHTVTPTPHECESVCPDCGKCLDAECTETACAEKCQGHTVTPPATESLTLTKDTLFAGLTGTSYATYNGDHTLGGYTITTTDVLGNTHGVNVLQFKKGTGTLTVKNVTVSSLTLIIASSYDYTANVEIKVGDVTLTMPEPATVNAGRVTTGTKNSNGYEVFLYTVTVELDAALTGDLVIKNPLTYAVYMESIEIVHGATETPAPTPHACESVCPDCGKCLDAECTETACAEKCQGHTVTPPVVEETYKQVTDLTTLKTGDKVVIGNPAHGKLLSMEKVSATSYYNKGVAYSATDFSNVTDSEIFVVTVNEDGTYEFVSVSGKVLALAASYTSLNDTGVNKTWKLVAVDGKEGLFYIENVGRSGLRIEWYSSQNNWSTYSSTGALFELALYTVPAAGSETPAPHECESVCPDCGKCLDAECTETACAEKCQGHQTTPPATAGGSADFDTIVITSNSGGDANYTNTYTTADGWKTVNSAIQAGGGNTNPQFNVVGDSKDDKAVCLNGKKGAEGKLTSPTLKGGISKLTINFTKMFTDTKLGATVTITDLSNGKTYTYTISRELDKNEKQVVYTESWTLEAPITGDFTIEIVNTAPSGNTGNKDRLTILDLIWE